MEPWIYDPTRPGELFELLDDEQTVECKACAARLPATQEEMRRHAEEVKVTAGQQGSCRGFWESSFPERFRRAG
jgi:hypothetical protein